MPTLWLLRHAKAANFTPGRGDAERPLTERGRTQADTIGRLLARQEPSNTSCVPPPPAPVRPSKGWAWMLRWSSVRTSTRPVRTPSSI